MKLLTALLAFIILCLPSSGQTFALVHPQAEPLLTAYSESHMAFTRRAPSATTVVGIVATCVGGAGGTLAGAGASLASIYASDASDLWSYTAAGFGVALAGVGLIIIGTAHEHRRWEIATPRQNEIGFTYNFR